MYVLSLKKKANIIMALFHKILSKDVHSLLDDQAQGHIAYLGMPCYLS